MWSKLKWRRPKSINSMSRLPALVSCALVAACVSRDPLLASYLAHRQAIVNHDWGWIAHHLSQDFLATHAAGILAASTASELDGQWKSFWQQATVMRQDLVICKARSKFDGAAIKGTLDLVVKRANGRTQQVLYYFVRVGNEWTLDGVHIYSPSHFGGKDLPCDEPLMNLEPISDRLVPLA